MTEILGRKSKEPTHKKEHIKFDLYAPKESHPVGRRGVPARDSLIAS